MPLQSGKQLDDGVIIYPLQHMMERDDEACEGTSSVGYVKHDGGTKGQPSKYTLPKLLMHGTSVENAWARKVWHRLPLTL